MAAARNLLLPESHYPGFQGPLTRIRSMPKTRLVLFLEPISSQPRPLPQPRRVSFPTRVHAQLTRQAKPKLSQSCPSYLPIPTSLPERSVPTAITRPCLSNLPHPRRTFSYLLDERGQRRCRCTISQTDSLGNQSSSSPRLTFSGQLQSLW